MLLERTAHHRHQHSHMLMHDDPLASYTGPDSIHSQRMGDERHSSSSSSVFDSMKGRGIIAQWAARKNGKGKGGGGGVGKDSSVAAQVNMEGGRDHRSSTSQEHMRGENVERGLLRSSAPPSSFDLEGWLNGGGVSATAGDGKENETACHPHRSSSFTTIGGTGADTTTRNLDLEGWLNGGGVSATAADGKGNGAAFRQHRTSSYSTIDATVADTTASRYGPPSSQARHHSISRTREVERACGVSRRFTSSHEPPLDHLRDHKFQYERCVTRRDSNNPNWESHRTKLLARTAQPGMSQSGMDEHQKKEPHRWASKISNQEEVGHGRHGHQAQQLRAATAAAAPTRSSTYQRDSVRNTNRITAQASTVLTGTFESKSSELMEMGERQRGVRFTDQGAAQQAQAQTQGTRDGQRRTASRSAQREQAQQQRQPRRQWKTAVDPKSGRTYYYDAVTRETQWRKPLELATAEERRAIQEKERKQKDFFSAMEANILRCMQQGQLPGSPKNGEESEVVGELRPSEPVTPAEKRSSVKGGSKKLLPKSLKPTKGNVRTISMMGDALIDEITKVEGGGDKQQQRGSKNSSPNTVTNFPHHTPQSASSDRTVDTSAFGGSMSAGPVAGATPMVAFGHHHALPHGQHRRTGSGGSQDRAIEQVRRAAEEMTNLGAPEGFSPLVGDDLLDSAHDGGDLINSAHGSATDSRRNSEEASSGDDALVPPPKVGDLKQLSKPSLANRNTCGSIYVGSTMSVPDKDATIKCVCGVYRAHMLQAAKDEASTGFRPPVRFDEYEIFNDRPKDRRSAAGDSPPRSSSGRGGRRHRSTLDSKNASSSLVSSATGSILVSQSIAGIEALSLESVESAVPPLDEITAFYRDVFRRSQMETDCIIMSLIYVERLIKETNGGVRPRVGNWRSVLFASMVMASKVWDDLSMWNADFSQACPAGVRFTLRRINELELAMLGCLKFSVKVPASEYAKYYFLLRSMMIRSGLAGDDLASMTPLDVEGAKKLEVVSGTFRAFGESEKLRAASRKALRSKSCGEVEGLIGERARESPRNATAASKITLEHVVNL